MKKYLAYISLTMIISASLSGQNFISENKQWNVRLVSGIEVFTDILRIEGDTVINDTDYSILRISHDSLQHWFIMGFLRESDGIVYFKSPYANEGVLYNFNLSAGESAVVKNFYCGDALIPLNVIKVDTVEYFGISRKRWHIGSNGQTSEYWVEGIGSLFGPVHTSFSYCVSNPSWELLCFHENDNLLYIIPGEDLCYKMNVGITGKPQLNDLRVFPNPVRRGECLNVNTTSENVSIQLTDAVGSVQIKNIYDAAKSALSNVQIHIPAFMKPGVYFLTVATRDGVMASSKIIIY